MDQPFDFSNLGAMLSQLGAMMQRAEQLPAGAVDWDSVRQTARQVIAQSPDPSVVSAEHERVRAAGSLAQLWLDGVTDLAAPSVQACAWSRSEWLEATFPAWQQLLEPIARSMQTSVADVVAAQELPEEMSAMLTPMMGMLQRISGVMAAQQVGQALGALARDAWSTADIGIPLYPQGALALVTANTRDFAASMELDLRDFETYLALREAAAQRLFHAAPWIGPRIRDAVAEHATSVHVDADRLRSMFADLDMSDPGAMQRAMGGGMELPMTEGNTAAITRIEVLITLIEGWIDHVTQAAHGGRIGSAGIIREALRRRRATGGPSERTMAELLRLELRPRQLREAAEFWARQENRDALWQHPDFLPDRLDSTPEA